MTDLELTDEDLDEFTRAITAAFRGADAVQLLRLIRFPRYKMPDFTNPMDDWEAVFHAFDDGVLDTPTPYRDLLRFALKRVPTNKVLSRIATDYADPPTARQEAGVRRVHVVQSSPLGRDRLRSELKAIKDAARSGHIAVTDSTSAAFLDLRTLLDARPDVLHVSGHGERGELIFEDAHGEADPVPAAAVVSLLSTYRDRAKVRIRAVVLNSCDSASVAQQFLAVADVLVAHEGPLDDECAILFAGELYTTLRSVPDIGDAAEIAAKHIERSCPTDVVVLRGGAN